MKLYFVPFACSLAVRIAVAEAELEAEFVQVVPGGALPDGRRFEAVSPMGYVPALETHAGVTLSEGPAVLTYLADLAAEDVLAPPPFSAERYEMLRWLNFIATELHKGVFHPLMSRDVPEGARAYARSLAAKPFAVLSERLAGGAYLLGSFSVADAYLLAVLNWTEHAGLSLDPWPVLKAWRATLRTRPAVRAAMAEEMPLLKAA